MVYLSIPIKETQLERVLLDCKVKDLKFVQNECQHIRQIEGDELNRINAYLSSMSDYYKCVALKEMNIISVSSLTHRPKGKKMIYRNASNKRLLLLNAHSNKRCPPLKAKNLLNAPSIKRPLFRGDV